MQLRFDEALFIMKANRLKHGGHCNAIVPADESGHLAGYRGDSRGDSRGAGRR